MTTRSNIKNFCPLPWTEVYIGHDTTGPCCINTELYNSTDVSDYLKSEELKTLKKEFLKGNYCRFERKYYAEDYEDINSGAYFKKGKIVYVEYDGYYEKKGIIKCAEYSKLPLNY